MSYAHLTKTEYVFIEKYFSIVMKDRQIAKKLKRGHESIYRATRKLKEGKTAIEIYQEYKENKKNCGQKPSQLPQDEVEDVNKKIDEDWTPEVFAGRKNKPISCSMKILYRMFEKGIFWQGDSP